MNAMILPATLIATFLVQIVGRWVVTCQGVPSDHVQDGGLVQNL